MKAKGRILAALLSLALAAALFTGVLGAMGGASLLRQAGSAFVYPFQRLWAGIGRAASGFPARFRDVRDLRAEADSLREENESLRAELRDAAVLQDEYARLRGYLTVREEHPDFAYTEAAVVGAVPAEPDGAGVYAAELTISKGRLAGVEAGMPVVTRLGLVGVVAEAGLSHSRVRTLLNASVAVGVLATRTGEAGLCEGDFSLAPDGRALLRCLGPESDVRAGDAAVTSGRGSVYPAGIPVGRVVETRRNACSRGTEAVLEPFQDLSDVRYVLVVTSSGAAEGDGT